MERGQLYETVLAADCAIDRERVMGHLIQQTRDMKALARRHGHRLTPISIVRQPPSDGYDRFRLTARGYPRQEEP